jgi:hypothetical protein
MATRERRLDRGKDQAARTIRTAGAEVRLTRRGAGVSIRVAAASVGMSQSMFGRIERAQMPNVTVAQVSLACSAVGLKFVGRAYPDADPVRDAGHARLLKRFRDRLPGGVEWRTEVPLPIPGDRRAWDAVCQFGDRTIAVEAEMRLDDLQALQRRIALKRRDGDIDTVILLIADTHGNRRHLADHRAVLRASLPLEGRAVLSALRAARAPAASGIVLL